MAETPLMSQEHEKFNYPLLIRILHLQALPRKSTIKTALVHGQNVLFAADLDVYSTRNFSVAFKGYKFRIVPK